MKRRDFLQLSASTLLASSGLGISMTSSGGRQLEKVGLQLSTVTPLMLQDFEGTLGRIAEIGYSQVEFSAMGFLGRPVSYIQDLLRKNNLEAPVGRITPRLPDGFFELSREDAMKIYREKGKPEHFLDNVAHSLEIALAMEQKFLNLPALMPDQFSTLDQVKRNIELINQAGDLCVKQGVLFGYHNHDWELKAVEGVVPLDLMIEQSEPGKVGFQLDAYWIVKGGGSLDDYLSRFAGRFPSCHMKDIDADGNFADVGHGEIDFQAFTAAAMAQGATHFFVERDNPPDPASSILRSYNYLSQMTF